MLNCRSTLSRCSAGKLFNALSYTNRKEYVQWIVDAKREETRKARLVKTIAMLTEGRKNPSGR